VITKITISFSAPAFLYFSLLIFPAESCSICRWCKSI